VHALGRLHRERRRAGHRLDVGRPHPGRVDDDRCRDVEAAAGLRVLDGDAGDPRTVAQHVDHRRVAEHHRSVRGRGAGDGERVPGVVHAAVVVLQRPGDDARVQPGRLAQRTAAGQVPVVGHAAAPAGAPRDRHEVVEQHAGADVGPLPVLREREQERFRGDQVRGERADHQVPLVQCLGDEPEVQLLEVTQPAVHGLAGPRRCAGGQVTGLEQYDGEAARGRVEGGTRAGDTAADDRDVEPPGLRGGERGLPARGGEVRARPRQRRHADTAADACRVAQNGRAALTWSR
jgi:hypothetical protein